MNHEKSLPILCPSSPLPLAIHSSTSCICGFSSVQLSRSVMSDSLRPHEPQHVRPLCPSLTPGVYSNSCPLSQWWHPTISSSVLSLLPSIFLSIRGLFKWVSFCIRWPKYWSFNFSILPMNIQDWFPLGWTGWIYLQSEGHSRVLQHQGSKASVFCHSAFFKSNSHPYMTTGKTAALTRWTLVGKLMSLFFNMLSRFVIGGNIIIPTL